MGTNTIENIFAPKHFKVVCVCGFNNTYIITPYLLMSLGMFVCLDSWHLFSYYFVRVSISNSELVHVCSVINDCSITIKDSKAINKYLITLRNKATYININKRLIKPYTWESISLYPIFALIIQTKYEHDTTPSVVHYFYGNNNDNIQNIMDNVQMCSKNNS